MRKENIRTSALIRLRQLQNILIVYNNEKQKPKKRSNKITIQPINWFSFPFQATDVYIHFFPIRIEEKKQPYDYGNVPKNVRLNFKSNATDIEFRIDFLEQSHHTIFGVVQENVVSDFSIGIQRLAVK